MGEPSGTLGSAEHAPAAHVSFFPSYVATPPRTASFALTASQNLLLHSFGYPAAPGATPSAATTSPTTAPSGTSTSLTLRFPSDSDSVARIMASEVWPASLATLRLRMVRTIRFFRSSSGTNLRRPVMTCLTSSGPTWTLQQYSLSEFSTWLTSITLPIARRALQMGSSSAAGWASLPPPAGLAGFSFFAPPPSPPLGLAPPLGLITGLRSLTM
mmetsp:Transcript_14859/g.62684  ORF Transcript_14859/g.62684 Transcript_14859/m.62684 type:complete len:214 (+) Transcript_14859:1431-2072(+)